MCKTKELKHLLLTTVGSRLASSSMARQIHLVKVFGSVRTSDAWTLRLEYDLKKRRVHMRCFGSRFFWWMPCSSSMFQILEQTYQFTPKRVMNPFRAVWLMLWSVLWWPSSRVFLRTSSPMFLKTVQDSFIVLQGKVGRWQSKWWWWEMKKKLWLILITVVDWFASSHLVVVRSGQWELSSA